MNEDGHKWLLQMKLRLSQKVHVISGATQQLVLSYNVPESKLKKIYNGINFTRLPELSSAPPASEEYILCVGHIQPRKRQEDAIRTLAEVSKDAPGLRLKLAGSCYDIKYHEMLKQLTETLNVSDRVDFLGIRTDIFELMQGASALMLCSQREALGWAILEAMAVELPVIASAVDGPAEIIENGKSGFLVPVGDIQGYADVLRRVLSQPQLATEIGLNGRKKVEKDFSAERMVEQIVDLYHEVAGW